MKRHHTGEPSIISTWIPVILKTYESYGLDSDSLLKEARIDPEDVRKPDSRIQIDVYERLWQVAISRTGDDCMGLRVISFLKPMTFHALGIALMAGTTIHESLNRLQRYYKVISNEVMIRIISDHEKTALCFTPFPNRRPPMAASVDAFMAVSVFYARTLDSDQLNPAGVEFMHPAPRQAEPFNDLFKAPVAFSARDNRMYFYNADILCPLPAANTEIALKNDEIAADYLARFENGRIEYRVRESIIESLGAGEPSLEKIAQTLGMSSRSLNRHLANRNTSYRRILTEVRKELARLYLRQKNLSVIETAFRLGYADSSNFTRAFKHWFGVSPSRYQDRL